MRGVSKRHQPLNIERAYAKRHSGSSSGDVVLSAALNLTYRRLPGYNSTVTDVKRYEALILAAHGGVGRVLAFQGIHTTALDTHLLFEKCVRVCILSITLIINNEIPILSVKRLLNTHIVCLLIA